MELKLQFRVSMLRLERFKYLTIIRGRTQIFVGLYSAGYLTGFCVIVM